MADELSTVTKMFTYHKLLVCCIINLIHVKKQYFECFVRTGRISPFSVADNFTIQKKKNTLHIKMIKLQVGLFIYGSN